MTDPMTMEHARRLAAQDSPLPSLAGPALRLLVERIDTLERDAGNDPNRLLMLIADIRWACGDKGERMQPELVQHIADLFERASAASAQSWVSTTTSTPPRNEPAIYWHRSEHGGFPMIADEWRDEHHLAHASHWLPYQPPGANR